MNELAPSIRQAELSAAYAHEQRRLNKLGQRRGNDGAYLLPVFGSGPVPATVMFIGEAPGKEETASGQPFVGKAGKYLDTLLVGASIQRETVFVTNVLKYRPYIKSTRSTRNRTPKPDEIADCLPLLKKELELIRPRLIVTLGNTPLKALCALAGLPVETIGQLHGSQIPLKIGRVGTCLIPLYHPASGIYNHALLPVMEADMGNLGHFMRTMVKIM